jgi:hypothetical protein
VTKKKVVPITRDKEGNMIISLAATQGSDDWIRAGRLKAAGKIKEYNEMMNEQMYVDEEE